MIFDEKYVICLEDKTDLAEKPIYVYQINKTNLYSDDDVKNAMTFSSLEEAKCALQIIKSRTKRSASVQVLRLELTTVPLE